MHGRWGIRGAWRSQNKAVRSVKLHLIPARHADGVAVRVGLIRFGEKHCFGQLAHRNCCAASGGERREFYLHVSHLECATAGRMRAVWMPTLPAAEGFPVPGVAVMTAVHDSP